MPTVSEPKWPETRERLAQAIKDFIEAKPDSVSDSEDVLTARLFGCGLRGQDLRAEVNLAVMARLEKQRVNTIRIHQPLWGGFPKHWAKGTVGSISWTEDATEAGKYTIQECALVREQLRQTAPDAVVEINGI